MQEIIVPIGESAKKVENFLKKKFPIGYVRKLFRRKALRINGQRGVANDVVRPGDRIELAIPFEHERSDGAQSRRMPEIAVIYENPDLIVVNKPAGIAVHEARGLLKRETLLGVLETKYKGSGVRPRLVHRIDKDTSGTLLVAKTEAAAETLESLFDTGEVGKRSTYVWSSDACPKIKVELIFHSPAGRAALFRHSPAFLFLSVFQKQRSCAF